MVLAANFIVNNLCLGGVDALAFDLSDSGGGL